MNQPLWTSPELPALVADDIAAAPAEPRWRRDWEPELGYGRHAGPAPSNAVRAAVAILFCRHDDGWALPLTLRHAGLSRHGGQVSFPGGLMDTGEAAQTAAARELHEELGQAPRMDWLGELAPLWVFASNVLVTPCVAAVDHWPAWTCQPLEVDCLLRLPAAELAQQHLLPPLEIERGPLRLAAPQLIVEGRSIWGVTATMLGELRGRLLRIESTLGREMP